MRVMGLVGGFGLGFLAAAALGRSGQGGGRSAYYDVDVQPGEPLPLEHIAALARAQRSGRLIEVELEHEGDAPVYEVELIDAQGREWELIFDAYTGELLAEEVEDQVETPASGAQGPQGAGS